MYHSEAMKQLLRYFEMFPFSCLFEIQSDCGQPVKATPVLSYSCCDKLCSTELHSVKRGYYSTFLFLFLHFRMIANHRWIILNSLNFPIHGPTSRSKRWKFLFNSVHVISHDGGPRDISLCRTPWYLTVQSRPVSAEVAQPIMSVPAWPRVNTEIEAELHMSLPAERKIMQRLLLLSFKVPIGCTLHSLHRYLCV